ncbi:MAG: hypothetical protein V3R99_06615 [Thermoguttaceae bacterium]
MRYFALLLMLLSITVCTVGCGEPAADTSADDGTPAADVAPDPDAPGDDDDDAEPAAGDDDDDAEPIPEPPAEGSTD